MHGYVPENITALVHFKVFIIKVICGVKPGNTDIDVSLKHQYLYYPEKCNRPTDIYVSLILQIPPKRMNPKAQNVVQPILESPRMSYQIPGYATERYNTV